MITINILAVGNLKEKFWTEAQKEYLKRLSKFAKVNVIEIEEKNNQSTNKITLEKEGKEILSKMKGHIILMDIQGKMMSSEELSQRIEKISQTSSVITFVIGSSHGVCQEVKDKANERISFGKNTFPHNLARVMLLEQVYRCFGIMVGSSYHK